MYLIQSKDKLHICYARFESAYYCACGKILTNYKINNKIEAKNIFGISAFVNVSCKECLAVAQSINDFEMAYKKLNHFHNLLDTAWVNKNLHPSETKRMAINKSNKYKKYKQ